MHAICDAHKVDLSSHQCPISYLRATHIAVSQRYGSKNTAVACAVRAERLWLCKACAPPRRTPAPDFVFTCNLQRSRTALWEVQQNRRTAEPDAGLRCAHGSPRQSPAPDFVFTCDRPDRQTELWEVAPGETVSSSGLNARLDSPGSGDSDR